MIANSFFNFLNTILSLDCNDWLIMASCVCLLNYLKPSTLAVEYVHGFG
jgi:hypothetical protein